MTLYAGGRGAQSCPLVHVFSPAYEHKRLQCNSTNTMTAQTQIASWPGKWYSDGTGVTGDSASRRAADWPQFVSSCAVIIVTGPCLALALAIVAPR